MTPDFERCHAVTAKWEGGWSNHPSDLGGATMYGVTQAVYDRFCVSTKTQKRSVRLITKDEALKIYFDQYWEAARCEQLHAGVDLAHYDAAVNSGVGRARNWLASAIGDKNPQNTVRKYCHKRLSFVQGLRTWKTFGRGWSRRIADIEAKGVLWATVVTDGRETAQYHGEHHAERAKAVSKNQNAGGVVTGGGSAAPVTVDIFQPDQIASSALLVILVVGLALAAFLFWRARINKDRADAYAREAEALK